MVSISTLSMSARFLARCKRWSSEELGSSSDFSSAMAHDLGDTGASAPQSSCRARSHAARTRSYSTFNDAVVSSAIIEYYAGRRL